MYLSEVCLRISFFESNWNRSLTNRPLRTFFVLSSLNKQVPSSSDRL